MNIFTEIALRIFSLLPLVVIFSIIVSGLLYLTNDKNSKERRVWAYIFLFSASIQFILLPLIGAYADSHNKSGWGPAGIIMVPLAFLWLPSDIDNYILREKIDESLTQLQGNSELAMQWVSSKKDLKPFERKALTNYISGRESFTEEEILELLDFSISTQQYRPSLIYAHPSTTEKILISEFNRLSKLNKLSTAEFLFRNPKFPEELLISLENHDDVYVRNISKRALEIRNRELAQQVAGGDATR